MKIESSSILMSANSSSIEKNTKEESLKAWIGDKRPNFEDKKPPKNVLGLQIDILEISEKAKSMQAENNSTVNDVEGSDPLSPELSDKDKAKLTLIQQMIEALTGKKVRFVIPKDIKITPTKLPNYPHRLVQASQQRAGWGVEYESHESHYEQQKMSFNAEGVVKTADGREIKFSAELNMSREFASRTDISVRAGDAAKIDPLVINFNGNAPALTETKFKFDIDSNGKEDQISFVAPGSGFLALDLNNDGKVNNGKELFGPNTGNGFAELAKYDSDGNNWIDENDAIYDKLRIWTKDESGADKLFALGQKGVGAIYLGNVDSNFSMKDSSNNLQGEIQKTGIFLKENGMVGTINHIDLAV